MKAENSWDGTHTYVWLEPDHAILDKLSSNLPFYKLYEILTFLLPHPQRQSHQNFGPYIFLGQHDINKASFYTFPYTIWQFKKKKNKKNNFDHIFINRWPPCTPWGSKFSELSDMSRYFHKISLSHMTKWIIIITNQFTYVNFAITIITELHCRCKYSNSLKTHVKTWPTLRHNNSRILLWIWDRSARDRMRW